MLGVFMCFIMLQMVLHDGMKRAEEEQESAKGKVVSLDDVPKNRAV